VVAFNRGEDGELFPAFGPADQQSEDRAIRTAKALGTKHLGLMPMQAHSKGSGMIEMG
jgi:hypothetical protein